MGKGTICRACSIRGAEQSWRKRGREGEVEGLREVPLRGPLGRKSFPFGLQAGQGPVCADHPGQGRAPSRGLGGGLQK